jgi:hypothetical protein
VPSKPINSRGCNHFSQISKVVGQIHDFLILKNRATDKSRLAQFHALIMFRDNEQFGLPFADVASIGIHSGKHGFMIEHVKEFIVEVFEELPEPSHPRDAVV